jgi:hypothetical protein
MKKIYFLTTLLLFLSVHSIAQTTVNFTSDKDVTIYSESGNAGNATGSLFVGRISNGSSIRRILVHFDISSIPSNAVVTSATLKFNVEQPHGGAFTLGAHKLAAAWGEGSSIGQGTGGGQAGTATTNDATWTSRFFGSSDNWSAPGGDFTASASATISNNANPFEFTSAQIAADVQSWITSSSSNNGWLIKSTVETTNGNVLKLSSKETGSASTKPTLSVTYTITAPVALKNFNGILKGQDARLQWQTSSEQNSDFFEIQHSTNGEKFATVGKVKAAGNSSEAKSYSFVHPGASAGKNYYRLAQHDVDGKVHYSSIVVLSAEKQISLQITPNPADKSIRVTAGRSLLGSTYTIISAGGQVAKAGVLQGQDIDVYNLNSGLYQLVIQTPEKEILRTQFIKK